MNDTVVSRHWADQAASDLFQKHPGKNRFVCASGISPSGEVHIGNFREVITVDFVVRALRERGAEVDFLYSWDDYDAFRKVPANLPQKDLLEKSLRLPLAEVPDPFGTAPNYASHFEKKFESELTRVGVAPRFIYQNQAYRSGKYTEGIAFALDNEKEIRGILDQYRTQPLPSDWTCVTLFCPECHKDTTDILERKARTVLAFKCTSCGCARDLDFAKEPGVKLLWRVDWPMRWAHEGVDFEPGGKDHSSQGGSYETGALIARSVWKKEPPHYVQYDFVLAKGLGTKLSSSSGNLITLTQAFEVYEPQVMRWVFASRKPNLDFTIAFDLDVLKAYDDFDRTERIAYGAEEAEELKKSYEARIYDLSLVEPSKKSTELPRQFGFRHLCNVLQIFEGDIAKTERHYEVAVEDKERFRTRAQCAWTWIQSYAPPEFHFRLRKETDAIEKTSQPKAVQELIALLESGKAWNEESLGSEVFSVMKRNGLDAKTFFGECYRILIDKKNGPKLASFLLTIGVERAAAYLKRAL